MVKKEYNQDLGFRFSKDGRQFDQYRQQKYKSSKTQLKEIRLIEARDQLLSLKEIDKVTSVIGAGKEATVLLARETKSKDLVCAKVFRYFTSTIKKRLRGTKHITKRGMAHIVAKQEYWNLVELYNAQVSVPRPRYLLGNIVVMDFINFHDEIFQPAPLLSDIDIRHFGDPEEILYESIEILAKMFLDAKFIHGDYSDHNLMITKKGLVTMDVSQSMPYNEKTFVKTPTRIKIDKAVEMLQIDLNNLINSFKKYRISLDVGYVCEEISKELPEKLQNFLKRSSKLNPLSHNTIDSYSAKELFRKQSVFERSGRKYQKKKR